MKKQLYHIFTKLEPISKQIQKTQMIQYKLMSVTHESSKEDILKAIYQQINFIKFPQYSYISLSKKNLIKK
jgi:predicted regulator of amino acid metabolism with ACT domain